jgi:hypothetical protein
MLFAATLHLEAGQLKRPRPPHFRAKVAADGLLSTKGLLWSDNYDTVENFGKQFATRASFAHVRRLAFSAPPRKAP